MERGSDSPIHLPCFPLVSEGVVRGDLHNTEREQADMAWTNLYQSQQTCSTLHVSMCVFSNVLVLCRAADEHQPRESPSPLTATTRHTAARSQHSPDFLVDTLPSSRMRSDPGKNPRVTASWGSGDKLQLQPNVVIWKGKAIDWSLLRPHDTNMSTMRGSLMSKRTPGRAVNSPLYEAPRGELGRQWGALSLVCPVSRLRHGAVCFDGSTRLACLVYLGFVSGPGEWLLSLAVSLSRRNGT